MVASLDYRENLAYRIFCGHVPRRFCTVREDRVVALVGEGILTPRGERPVDWRFPAQSLLRARRALRIAQDFEIELPAVALVLDLLDEIEALRRAVEGRRP